MTIRELAKKIGVSPSSISIVLNGQKGVSEETRAFILDAIQKYNYIPQRKNKLPSGTKTILLIKYYKTGFFVEENQSFISSEIDAIETSIRKRNGETVLKVIKNDLRDGLLSINFQNYCGAIFMATELLEEDYDLVGSIPIPCVYVDNPISGHNYSKVNINNRENVRLCLQYLKDCGHKEIGFIGSKGLPGNFQERYDAFHWFIREMGFSHAERDEFHLTPTILGAHADLNNILRNRKDYKPCSCFFAANDTIGLGAMKAFQENGFVIPDDISIIGFDDIPYSAISVPPLTTVHVNTEIIGKQAVHQLFQLIGNSDYQSMKSEFTGNLVVRNSVRKINI